uniref:Putative secreted protein n=1 Tax=Anopheles darlingi TaxID=43151 RepID=A0A2M4DMK5_ANODA
MFLFGVAILAIIITRVQLGLQWQIGVSATNHSQEECKKESVGDHPEITVETHMVDPECLPPPPPPCNDA